MKTLYLDCFAGASGDMFVGALLDLGLELNYLGEQLKNLPILNYRIQSARVNKNGISATSFEVILESNGNDLLADSEYSEVDIEFGENGTVINPLQHGNQQNETRNFREIQEIIEQSDLSETNKYLIQAIYLNLSTAEAEVHGNSVEDVHFHEVGGTDAIIDISSAVIGIEALGIEQIIVSPIHLGSGFVKTAHGMLPIPAPATAKLLRDCPVYSSDVKGELITPTGAAILTTLADGYGSMPLMTVEKVGHGAGKRDRIFPNILRAYLGEAEPLVATRKPVGFTTRDPFPSQHHHAPNQFGYHEHSAVMLEANIDDMNPQFYQPLMNQLLEIGALDITFTPTQMKKNRPGIILSVLSPPDLTNSLIEIIFRQTTTIGIRTYPVTKHMLDRQVISVSTKYGPVLVKLSRLNNQVVNISPEFESCQEISSLSNVPLKEVHAAALASAQSSHQMVSN